MDVWAHTFLLSLFFSFVVGDKSRGIFQLEKENYAIVPSVTPKLRMVTSSQLKCFTYCLRSFTKCTVVVETLSINNKYSCQIYDSTDFGDEHFVEKENSKIYVSFSEPLIVGNIEDNVEPDGQASPLESCEIAKDKDFKSGVYLIKHSNGESRHEYCDTSDTADQWINIQHRLSSSGDGAFNKYMYWHKAGHNDGGKWLGLTKLFTQTNGKSNTLVRLEVRLNDDRFLYVIFKGFYVENETNKFRLHTGNYLEGDAWLGDLWKYHDGMKYSVRDQDFDTKSGSCSQSFGNFGWWYKACIGIDFNSLKFKNGTMIQSFNEGVMFMKITDIATLD